MNKNKNVFWLTVPKRESKQPGGKGAVTARLANPIFPAHRRPRVQALSINSQRAPCDASPPAVFHSLEVSEAPQTMGPQTS